jgi:hypothetical protein
VFSAQIEATNVPRIVSIDEVEYEPRLLAVVEFLVAPFEQRCS